MIRQRLQSATTRVEVKKPLLTLMIINGHSKTINSTNRELVAGERTQQVVMIHSDHTK